MNSTEKYWWMMSHPALNSNDKDCSQTPELEIEPHMVCPETNSVVGHPELDTKEQIWIEVMIPYYDEQFSRWGHMHVTECDGGGDSWDEAIDDVYQKVLTKYGTYTQEEHDAFWGYDLHEISTRFDYLFEKPKSPIGGLISEFDIIIGESKLADFEEDYAKMKSILDRPGLSDDSIAYVYRELEHLLSDRDEVLFEFFTERTLRI